MKLLRKLIIRVLLLVVLAGSIIGGASVLKSYNATKDLTLSKVEGELSLKSALVEEKIESTVRMIEILGYDSKVMEALKYNKKGNYSVTEISNSTD